jgi:hypothetical protein
MDPRSSYFCTDAARVTGTERVSVPNSETRGTETQTILAADSTVAYFQVTPHVGGRNKRVILSDISPCNHKKTNGFICEAVNGNVSSPEEISDGLHINPRSLHNHHYLSNHLQSHLVYSCVDWKWRSKQGKDLDLCLHSAVHDELNREKSSGKKKTRAIDLELLANVLWSLLAFLYGSRYLKT